MTNNALSADEANKLFNEVSKAVMEGDGTALSDVLSQETPDDQEQPEEDTSTEVEDTDEVEEDTPQEDNDDNEPAEEAGSNEKADDKQDPIAKLEAQIANLQRELQASKSQLGRVSSLQSRLAKLDQQLKERTSSTSGRITEKVDPKIRQALKDLEDTDPALANSVATAIKAALEEVESTSNAQVADTLKTLRDLDYDAYIEEQKTKLLTTYPNAPQVFASEHWKTWKANAPEHIKSLATSDSADAMLMALELYKKDMLEKYPHLAQGNQPAAAKTDDAGTPVNEEAKRIEAERAKRKQTAANVSGGKAPGVPAKGPVNPDALFREAMEQARKRRDGLA